MPNLNNILVKYNVTPCSRECVDGVDMGPHAEKAVWHHIECPNHTSACCTVVPDDPNLGDD